MSEHNWHSLVKEKLFSILKSDINGLNSIEVAKRLEQYGKNELPKKKGVSSFIIFLEQFKSPLIYILIIAGIISLIFLDKIDAGVIFTAVIVNTIVGFFQEKKAQNALAELRRAVVIKTRVKRDGEELEIDAKDLVIGDIIVLEAGDKVPADARLLFAKKVQVNEAALTGESWEVDKDTKILDREVAITDRINMIYMGTVFTSGKAEAIIVNTGLNTEIGKIASMLQDVEEEDTPLQKRLEKFSRQIGFGVLAIVLFILFFGVYLKHDFFEMFEIAVAVAVSAIPEGLIVALTVVLAIGMQKILKQNGLVRKLVAAEALGSTTVVCTDKTGTLTSGEMRVTEIITSDFHFDTLENMDLSHAKQGWSDIIEVLKIGVLCNEAVVEHEKESMKHVKIFGNMTEKALLRAGMNFGLHRNKLIKEYPELDIIPFDSEKKYMATLHKSTSQRGVLYVKGAPEKILEKASYYWHNQKKVKINDQVKKNLQKKFEKLSGDGLRILAFAYKNFVMNKDEFDEENINDLVFVGFIGMKDPIREGVKDTIKLCNRAGIKIVMITGDHKLTAKAIANEVGIDTKKYKVIQGEDLEKISDKDFYEQVDKISVYARVTPADKLRIVKAWQHRNDIVAMTGDGVNDAPALKSANIGVAMGSGTEVAKGASDLVILDDHFSTIVAAVQQGRVIYDNIKKVVLYLMSDSLAEVLIIIFALVVGWPLPLLATQILWINIIDDGLPGMALTLDPEDPGVMKEKPISIDSGVISNENKILIVTISLITAVSTLFLFYYFWQSTGNVNSARTTAFTGLALSTLMYVFSCRTLRHDFFASLKIKNWYLIGAVLIGLVLQLMAVYVPFFQKVFHTVPLGIAPWVAIILQGILIIAVVEFIKGLYLVRFDKKK